MKNHEQLCGLNLVHNSRICLKTKDFRAIFRLGSLERAKGIEPSYAAWEAAVLPLNYARLFKDLAYFQKSARHLLGTDNIAA
jgi:hypothetical protein